MGILYNKYSSALYGVIKRIIKNDALAEETLQDAFIKIWNRIENYDSTKGRLFTWMLNVTRNLAIDKMRSKEISKQSKTGSLENIVSKVENRAAFELPIEVIGIQEILLRLPDEQKFVVEHLYLKGYTQAELAEEFDIPLGTVKTRLRLAMLLLREIFQVS